MYFQPPEKSKIDYPSIIYTRASAKTDFANDNPYNYRLQYTITVIDKDPDSVIPTKLAMLPMCTFERHYIADNLNHDVYSIYY